MAKTQKKPQTWKDLAKANESAARRPVSARVRVKKVFQIFKRLFLAALVCSAGAGAYYAYNKDYFSELLTPQTDSIRTFKMKSTGFITAKWVFGYLDIPKGTKLSEINIFFLKDLLEDIGQIDEALIRREYPHTLRIDITEHEPLVKTAVRMDSNVEYFMMSAQGKFFRPVCIPDEVLGALPSITGIKIIIGESGPLNYPHAQKLRELLAAAEDRLPQHAKTWKSIDLAELSRLTVPLITVTTADRVRIIFAAKDFEKQLDRLEYILKYSQAKSLAGIEQIDLSLTDRADVKLAE